MEEDYEEDCVEQFYDDDEPLVPFKDGPLRGKVVKVTGWGRVACDVVADNGEGALIVVMVGDDRKHEVEADACVVLGELDYCHECGAIGCVHDGLDRSEET